MPDFATLKTRVKDYLIDVPQKTDALVGAWINRAVEKAEDKRNFKHMEASVDIVTVVDTRVLATLPTRWKELRELPYFTRNDTFNTTQDIGHATKDDDMRKQYADLDDGVPEFLRFSEADDEIRVWPLPDGGSDYADGEYRVTVPYWQTSATLVNNADTNWFTDNAEWYLVFFAAAEGMLFNRDTEEATTFFQRAGVELGDEVRTDKQTQKRQTRTMVPRRDGVFGVGRRPPRKL